MKAIICTLCAALGLWPADSSASNAMEHALRATVRINSGETSGTGFLVQASAGDADRRQHFLVSAAHVFAEMKEETCQVVFRTRRDDGTFTRAEAALTIRDGAQPLWTRHPEMDAALIPITPPEDVDLLPFAESQVAASGFAEDGKLRVGQAICIPCFPAKLESNPAGWPVLRRGHIASHPLTPLASAPTFLVDVSSFGGESGAPVITWKKGEPMVVGLISSMQRQTDAISMPFEQRTVHTPLGLGIAVQSPFVLELLATWRQTTP